MWLMIGEKLKFMDEDKPQRKALFDDDYFAEMIISQEENIHFYGNSVIQCIIDYQFEKVTRTFMQGVFCFYFFFFVCPYLVTLVSNDPKLIASVFKICLLP